MKQFTLIITSILIAVFLAFMTAQAKSCEDNYQVAWEIMEARQRGIDKATIVGMVKESFENEIDLELALLLIDDAYKKKVWPKEKDKITMMEQFSRSLYKICVANQSRSSSHNISIETLAINAANDINQQTPIYKDEHTRLNSALAIGKLITLNYTLLQFSADEVSSTYYKGDIDNLIVETVTPLCLLPELKGLIKEGAAFQAVYTGKHGGLVSRVMIDRKFCGY